MMPSVRGSNSASLRMVGAVAGADAGGVEHLFRGDRGADDIAAGQRRPIAEMAEKIAAQQRAGRLLVEHARFPAMRHVRRVDIAHALAAEVEHLAIVQGARLRGRRGRAATPRRRCCPCATWARGAASSHLFIEPHSSASTWPNVIQRRLSTGTIFATAPTPAGRSRACRNGTAAAGPPSTRNWLKVKPAGGAPRPCRSTGDRCRRRSRRCAFPCLSPS